MLPMSFDGVYMFGTAVRARVAQMVPVQHQQISYSGLDGVEETRLGERGAWTFVKGKLYGATPGDLAAAIQTFRYAARAGWSVLTDGYGQEWPAVRLESFEESDEPVCYDPGGLGYCKDYQATFFHQYVP
jgi:hypothetical protein